MAGMLVRKESYVSMRVKNKAEKADALLALSRLVPPYTKVFAVYRGHTYGGMTRFYDFYTSRVEVNEVPIYKSRATVALIRITHSLAIALGYRYSDKRECIACYDPNDVVSSLAYALFPSETANPLCLITMERI